MQPLVRVCLNVNRLRFLQGQHMVQRTRPVRAPQLQAALAIAAAGGDWRQKDPSDVRVLIVGSTGYIGKFVTRELVKRGYNTVALARERSGIKGKSGPEDTRKVWRAVSHVHFALLRQLRQLFLRARSLRSIISPTSTLFRSWEGQMCALAMFQTRAIWREQRSASRWMWWCLAWPAAQAAR
jgi:NmrA-like family